MFDGYSIDWDKVQFYYDLHSSRINYIYFTCESPQEAHRIMRKRNWFQQKLNRYHVSLTALSPKISQSYDLFEEPDNVLVIMKPDSVLEVVEELPTGRELIEKLLI